MCLFCHSEESLYVPLCVCACLPCCMHARTNKCPYMCAHAPHLTPPYPTPPPSGGQWGDGGPLGWNAAYLHVSEGAPSLAAEVRDRGRGRDNVLQPVEGDDEQRQQEHEQAEEKPHVDINVARTSRRWGGRRRGGRGWGEAEEGPIVYWRDSSLIMVYRKDIHPWHLGWRSAWMAWEKEKDEGDVSLKRNAIKFNIQTLKRRKSLFFWWSCQRFSFTLRDISACLMLADTKAFTHTPGFGRD